MDRRMLQYFKKSLEAQLETVSVGKEGHFDSLKHAEDTQQPMDLVDLANTFYSREFSTQLHNRRQRFIRELREALQRIENGDFGICEVCADDIGVERLRAQPTTTVCIACKRKQECMEKCKVA
jgi:DnaK suppressor protein